MSNISWTDDFNEEEEFKRIERDELCDIEEKWYELDLLGVHDLWDWEIE